MTQLRGVTWDHPRGVDPVLAVSRAWSSEPGAPRIAWEARSLAAFEDASIAELAETYDVIAIDHPHLGLAIAEGALAPVPTELDPVLDGSGDGYVGLSLESYRWDGTLWALPADAATMVSATVDPEGRPQSWAEVLEHARRGPRGSIALPANPTHLLLTALALAEALDADTVGSAPSESSTPTRQSDGRPLWWTDTIDHTLLAAAIDTIHELLAFVPEWCLDADPIAVLDALSLPDGPTHVPLVYGYAPYARPEPSRRLVHFADAPSASRGPVGTVLGGVGFAASARRGDPTAALDVVRRLASGRLQCGIIPDAGGQPAHAAATADPRIDADYAHFFSRTARTMDRSFLRPRTPGYPGFQRAAADRLHEAIRSGRSADEAATLVCGEWEARAH